MKKRKKEEKKKEKKKRKKEVYGLGSSVPVKFSFFITIETMSNKNEK